MLLREAILDNPILIKHLRSRLRKDQLFPSIVGVVVLCAFLLWIAMATNSLGTSGGITPFLILQGVLLFIAGTSQVATVMAHAKDSGIIDFHRISPVRPWALVVGFVLGGAVREWLMLACTIPFALMCVAGGSISLPGYLLIFLDMVVVAVLYHTMAVLAGLVSPKPRNVSGGVVALVFMLHTMLGTFAVSVPALPTILPTVSQAMDWGRGGLPLGRPAFFGAELPAFLLSLLHQIPLLFFLFIAAERKMRSDRAFLYSKPMAVGIYAVVGVLLLGDVVGLRDVGGGPAGLPTLIATYGMAFAAILLITAVTPPAGDFANGVLRAKKQGLARAPVWSDLAANWAPMVSFCGMLGVTALVTTTLTSGASGWSGPLVASTFVGVCVVYYFSSARQAFDLMFRKNGGSYLALMLFILWLLPLLIGGMAAASNLDKNIFETILGLSPITGIYMTSLPGGTGGLSGAAGMAISSSLLFAIAFTQLRMQAERRASEGALKVRE